MRNKTSASFDIKEVETYVFTFLWIPQSLALLFIALHLIM